MVMQLSKQWESYALFGIPAKTYGGGVGAILNTVWITVMVGEHELTSYCHLLPPPPLSPRTSPTTHLRPCSPTDPR